MPELERWLPALSPPPGGAQRLARALDARRDGVQDWLRGLAPLLATATAVLLTSALVWRTLRPPADEARLERALAHVASTTAGVRVAHGDAIERPSPRSDVRVFIVWTDGR